VIGKKARCVCHGSRSSRMTYACDYSVEHFSNALLANREIPADPPRQTPLSSRRGEFLTKLFRRNNPHYALSMLMAAPNSKKTLGRTVKRGYSSTTNTSL